MLIKIIIIIIVVLEMGIMGIMGLGSIRVLCVIVGELRRVIRLGKLRSRYFRILIRGYS